MTTEAGAVEMIQPVGPQAAETSTAEASGVESVAIAPGIGPLISTAAVATLSATLIGLMLIGSFWDLTISESMVNPDSWFGEIFAAYGALPSSLALVISGLLLIVFHNQNERAPAIGQIISGSFVLTVGVAMSLFMPILYLAIHPVIIVSLGVVITVGAGLIALKLSKGADRRVAIRVAVVLVVVVVVEMMAVNLIKLGWERPRMRFLITGPGIEFAPWWSPGTGRKAELIRGGVSSDEFKSFPSGHTASGAVLILLTALIPLRASLQRFAPTFFWVGAAWGIAVGVSRVIAGAHFVTDAVAGFSITFIVILAVYRMVFPQIKLTTSLTNNGNSLPGAVL